MSDRDDLVTKLTAQRAELSAQVEALSEDAASTPPSAGEWSAKQQLAHLAQLEALFARACRRAVDEDRPDLGVIWQHPQGQYEEANGKPLPVLLEELSVARAGLLKGIAETTDDQFARVGRNTPFGDLTILQLYRAIYRHDRMHMDQIAGRESSFVPKRTG